MARNDDGDFRMITSELIKQLRDLESKARPGPWEFVRDVYPAFGDDYKLAYEMRNNLVTLLKEIY